MSEQILSFEQQYAFNKFCKGENLLISGSGGTGKSFLIKNLVQHLVQQKKYFQVTGLTGCCCVLLSNNIQINGKNLSVKTISSFSGIRLCKGDNDKIIENVVKNKFSIKTWKSLKVLIIDEVSMMSSKVFTVLEKIARITRNNNKPFGGIQIILLGDFLQLPPVPDYSDKETSKFAFEAEEWYNVIPLENHIELKTIFRQKDPIFREILNEIRIGELSQKNKEILQKHVGRKYIPEDHNGIIPIQILPTRNQVSNINKIQYDELKTEEFKYISKTVTTCKMYIENQKPFSIEDTIKCQSLSVQALQYEIKNFESSLPIEETLLLKVGVPVMIIVNLDIDNNVCNGTLGIISSIVPKKDVFGEYSIPTVRFSNGIERVIERHTWQNGEYPNITISQLPLILSYASSVHKQQGATMELARMSLGYSVFEDSQTYVALSRVTSLDGLYLDSFHAQKITVNKKAKEFYSTFPAILENTNTNKSFESFAFNG
jgi:ATP-dependent DNA helicase PIF1